MGWSGTSTHIRDVKVMPVDQSLYTQQPSTLPSTDPPVRSYTIRQSPPDSAPAPTPVMEPGAAVINTPSGDVHRYIPGTEYVYRANYVLSNTALQISSQQQLIADYLVQDKLIQYLEGNNQGGAVSLVRLDDALFNPAAQKDKEYYTALDDRRLLYLSILGDRIETYRTTDKAVKSNVNDVSDNATFSLESILDIIIDEGLDWLLSKVNELLPPGYDLNLDMDGDGNITSIGIGGVSYNPQDGSISYNLSMYTGYIGQVVGYINEFLPDFMDIGFTGTSIIVLGTEISFGDLIEGEFKPVTGNISIGRLGGEIKLSVGGREMSLFNIDWEAVGEAAATAAIAAAAGYVTRAAAPGIGSVNNAVYNATGIDNFISIDFTDRGFSPRISIGPLSYDSANGSIGISGSWIANNATRALETQVFNKLPGPLGNIASRIWRSIPFEGIVADLFGIPVGDTKQTPPDPDSTINIDNTGRPSNPRISSSPVDTYTPSVVSTNDYGLSSGGTLPPLNAQDVPNYDFSGGYTVATSG